MNGDAQILMTLTEIASVANNPRLGYQRKMQTILDKIVRCMGCSHGSLMLVKNRSRLEVTASTRAELIGLRHPIDEHRPSGWVVRHKRPLYVDNLSRSPQFEQPLGHYTKEAFLLVPVMRGASVIGVLNVTEKLGEDAFTPQEQEHLLTIAGHLIAALENVRMTETLKQQRQELQRKNDDLKRLERIRTELFNMLIHDLKGHLSEVMANIDILTYTLNDDNLEYVEDAQAGCDTLFRMVSDLLDIARLEDGSLKLLPEKIQPADLIREALSRLPGLARRRNISLVEHPPAGATENPLKGDRGILLRVMQNLLTNAIHHSPEGETIMAGYAYPDPQWVAIFVHDNGPGIPPEHHAAIFDKYMQVKKINDGRIYSTGLGLTFCKMAVEAHGGSILVESDGQHGTRFTFTLPGA